MKLIFWTTEEVLSPYYGLETKGDPKTVPCPLSFSAQVQRNFVLSAPRILLLFLILICLIRHLTNLSICAYNDTTNIYYWMNSWLVNHISVSMVYYRNWELQTTGGWASSFDCLNRQFQVINMIISHNGFPYTLFIKEFYIGINL